MRMKPEQAAKGWMRAPSLLSVDEGRRERLDPPISEDRSARRGSAARKQAMRPSKNPVDDFTRCMTNSGERQPGPCLCHSASQYGTPVVDGV